MKKLFTLMMLLVVLGASAQNYRRWNFTSWSAQTIANLMADAAASSLEGWSDIEKKADAGEGKVAPEATAGKCFWLTDAEGGTLKANGVVISELEGLEFGATYTNNRSLAIAIDYPSTSLGEYAGPQYLWLGGGGKNMVCFTIPRVRIGQKITMTVESHKPSDARGVELYVGSIAAENKIGESFKPTTQDTYTWENWTLPEGTSGNDDGETVDIIVYNTSGCHIYNMEVGDNSQLAKVAFLYGGDLSADRAYSQVSGGIDYTVTPVEASGALSMDLATEYDAIIISSTVTNADAIASLNTIHPFVPTLNLNPAVYEAWGVGTTADAGTTFAVVANPNHALYRNVELIEDPDNEGSFVLVFASDDTPFQSPTLAGRFAGDQVLATAMGNPDAIAIHQHNMDHNGYLYIPYTQELMYMAASDLVLNNAVTLLANTKSKQTEAAKPSFSLEYKNMNTNVTIRSSVPQAEIFYTTDGSEPTEQSTRYTEPFNLTQATTVKAVVRGDGYSLSQVAEQLVDLKQQAAQPAIAQEQQDGKTIVTLSADNAEAVIYYNYSGSNDRAKSTVYTEPIAVSLLGRTIYAFASAEGYVDSELAQQAVMVKNAKVRIDVLSHMDANSETYNGGSTSTSYFFSWGKDKASYNYFDPDDFTEEYVTDPETGEEKTVVTYNTLSPEEEKDFENGWMLRSRGQLVTWENLTTGENFGNSDGYNFATVDDQNPYFPTTKAVINLADKNTVPSGASFPYNAYLVTTQKYQGPFDVVANIGSIVKPTSEATHSIVLQTSVDGNQWESQWQAIGDTIVIQNRQRLTTNVVRSYEGTDEVYVRAYLCGNNSKAGFYDIYIARQGEQSEQLLTGIEEATAAVRPATDAYYYDLQGRRLSARPERGLYIHQGRKYVAK